MDDRTVPSRQAESVEPFEKLDTTVRSETKSRDKIFEIFYIRRHVHKWNVRLRFLSKRIERKEFSSLQIRFASFSRWNLEHRRTKKIQRFTEYRSERRSLEKSLDEYFDRFLFLWRFLLSFVVDQLYRNQSRKFDVAQNFLVQSIVDRRGFSVFGFDNLLSRRKDSSSNRKIDDHRTGIVLSRRSKLGAIFRFVTVELFLLW